MEKDISSKNIDVCQKCGKKREGVLIPIYLAKKESIVVPSIGLVDEHETIYHFEGKEDVFLCSKCSAVRNKKEFLKYLSMALCLFLLGLWFIQESIFTGILLFIASLIIGCNLKLFANSERAVAVSGNILNKKLGSDYFFFSKSEAEQLLEHQKVLKNNSALKHINIPTDFNFEQAVETKATVVAQVKSADQSIPKPRPAIEEYVNDCLLHKYQELPETRSWNSDPALKKVLDLLNSGDNIGACCAAETLIAQFRDFANLYAWWGSALLRMGSLDKARQVLKDGLESAKEKYPLCNRLGEIEWKARDLDNAIYWWAQGVHCQESLSASNYGGSEGAYLYLYYVAEALGLDECSKAFSIRVDAIRPGMIRLNTETADDLLSLARSGKNHSIEQVLKEIVLRYMIPKKTSTTKVDPNELSCLIRQIEEIASFSRDADSENDVKAIKRLAELGDTQAIPVLTRASKHILMNIAFTARDAIEKIKSANR